MLRLRRFVLYVEFFFVVHRACNIDLSGIVEYTSIYPVPCVANWSVLRHFSKCVLIQDVRRHHGSRGGQRAEGMWNVELPRRSVRGCTI